MKKILFLFISLIPLTTLFAGQNGFAVVVDSASYANALTEIEKYRQSIEEYDGLKTFLVIDKWHRPDSIRSKLIQLHNQKNNPIEGAVFIGDVPIAMIRNAQHLTTAFKMDQDRYAWNRSSVPSDRYYDDFHLIFDFVKQDSIRSNYFYYSLNSASPQGLQPTIYSGRIKPFNTPDKYNDLKKYLKKAVRTKEEKRAVTNFFYFAGHGYNSESMIARIDEKIAIYEQFPWLKTQANHVDYLDHSMETHIKSKLLNELQRNELDIALLHHHGSWDTEYLNGMPNVSNPRQQIDGVKYFLRSKVRASKDAEKSIRYYIDNYDVPRSWFDGTFDPQIILEDSAFNAGLDVHISDVEAIDPNAHLIILDACFNGSFHLDNYIAGAYIFNSGNTVAVKANSVNVLQDKWANEFLGLLGHGVNIGQWARLTTYLESHIIGDPTFSFSSSNTQPADLNQRIANNSIKDTKYWLKLLKSPYAEQQTLALRMLYDLQYKGLSDILFDIFKKSDYGVVRMECLKLLTAYNDDNFINCLQLALDDSYELIQRQAVYLTGKSGDDRLIEPLLKIAIRNNTAERVRFNVQTALQFFPEDKLLESYDAIYAQQQHFAESDSVKARLKRTIKYYTNRWKKDNDAIFDPETKEKELKLNIRNLRNNNYHPKVADFCRFAKEYPNEELQTIMIEALGWFNISAEKTVIIQTCKDIIADEESSFKIKQEAERTLNRLQLSWYR